MRFEVLGREGVALALGGETGTTSLAGGAVFWRWGMRLVMGWNVEREY